MDERLCPNRAISVKAYCLCFRASNFVTQQKPTCSLLANQRNRKDEVNLFLLIGFSVNLVIFCFQALGLITMKWDNNGFDGMQLWWIALDFDVTMATSWIPTYTWVALVRTEFFRVHCGVSNRLVSREDRIRIPILPIPMFAALFESGRLSMRFSWQTFKNCDAFWLRQCHKFLQMESPVAFND